MTRIKNILVIAPHPDDEVLGCGATIASLAGEGHRVFVVIATRGTPSLYSEERIANVRNEALAAHRILGVTKTFFLDFPAPELDTVPLAEISRSFAEIVMDNAIDTVYLPHRGDIHNDHQLVFQAGLVACRPVGGCTVKELLCYETMSETEWAAPAADSFFIPTLFENCSDTFQLKIDAMNCFQSQIRHFPNPRSEDALVALAKYRGATIGVTFAEAFSVIRIVRGG